MKTIFKILIGISMLSITNIKAQITLDNIVYPKIDIGRDFYTAQIGSNETKYVFLDTVANTFSLYNMDFTPFMTNIVVPEPFIQGSVFMQPIYITRGLFDCDTSNIEYAYEATTNVNKPFRILRTDGTALFQLDSANGPYCLGGCLGLSDITVPIRNTSDGAKLFLQKYPSGVQRIYIYSLCGSLPTNNIFDYTTFKSLVTIFPNPSQGLLTFVINLPDNINSYELIILDNSAKEIRREKINLGNSQYTIDITTFSSGTYFYSLSVKDKSYQSGKFILTK